MRETGWHEAVGGTGILAQKIMCILKLQTDLFFVCFFLCWRLSCVKILPTSYMKKESLDKEKPCNVVLNIYIYIYFIYIYNIAVTI